MLDTCLECQLHADCESAHWRDGTSPASKFYAFAGIDFRIKWQVAVALVKKEQVVAADVNSQVLNVSLARQFTREGITQSEALQAQISHVNQIFCLWIIVVATACICKSCHITLGIVARPEAGIVVVFIVGKLNAESVHISRLPTPWKKASISKPFQLAPTRKLYS